MANRGSFEGDYKWQEKFSPTIRRIVGPHLLVPAPMDLDQTEATDWLVFKASDMRVAARVRDVGYVDKYGREFTIRSKRDSGARTEWPKVIEDGFGDWMFYGHSTGHGLAIYPWWIINLNVLRELHTTYGRSVACGWHIPNGDGTYFHAFDIKTLTRGYARSDLLIAWAFNDKVDRLTLM